MSVLGRRGYYLRSIVTDTQDNQMLNDSKLWLYGVTTASHLR